jgi:ferredoxin
MTATLVSLGPLVDCLRNLGYTVIGPSESGGAIVLAELATADDLPHGWAAETGPGRYRLRRRDDRAAFGHSAGPQAWKRFLHPPREPLWSADRVDGTLRFTEAEPAPTRFAFLGVRPCDLQAIAVQDRVLGASSTYAARRDGVFLIAVNCTEPSSTCFCVSAGGAPEVRSGFDLVLTELVDEGNPRYVAAAGSDAGAAVLAQLPQQTTTDVDTAQVRAAIGAAAGRMQRSLPAVDLRRLLADSLEATRWEDVAARCLTCGNCTLTCPTCFCTSVTDTTDLTGDHAERWQQWASCFETDYSYLHGGAIRPTARSRYRQWLTHKLGTWHDQFGESGCVGCGRCIVWCPVGIDITVEANALARESEATP